MPAPDDPTPAGPPPGLTPAKVNVIRLAMLGGILLFGAVGWFVTHRAAFVSSLDEGTATLIGVVFTAMILGTGGFIALIRQRFRQAETFAVRARYAFVGYAVAEAAGLLGGVYLLLTGNVLLFLLGLVVFLVAFLLFPVTEA